MKKCVERSVGEESAKDFEDFLAAAHAGQPLVNERDAKRTIHVQCGLHACVEHCMDNRSNRTLELDAQASAANSVGIRADQDSSASTSARSCKRPLARLFFLRFSR